VTRAIPVLLLLMLVACGIGAQATHILKNRQEPTAGLSGPHVAMQKLATILQKRLKKHAATLNN
jgi:hypothetical protein